MNQAGLSSSREEPTELLGACSLSFLFAFSLLFIAPLLPLLQMQAYDLDKSGDFVSAHRQQGFFFFSFHNLHRNITKVMLNARGAKIHLSVGTHRDLWVEFSQPSLYAGWIAAPSGS